MNPLDDTLNIGATLPRASAATDNTTSGPLIDDLEGQQTIKLPGSGSLVFGRYRLQRVLGRGGMGVVWLAVDTKLERAVALKFLPDIIGADPVALKELKDETRRGLELAHPNIVRIYDFVDDDEAAAISMEFVDGKSLAERRVAKPQQVFSVEELGPWVGQMCDALDYAHQQKRIVHRDLKPANLMVNSESQIKITDFGIARSVTDTMSRLSRTAHHGTSGTLLYMSPQQAMGDRPRPTDDVYAIGATLYELLTGKPPFYSGDITMQITAKTPPPLKQRREELEIAASDVIPSQWEQAIASCLDKDPERRPQSAGELARLLGVSVKAESTAAPVKTKAGGLKSIHVETKKETAEKAAKTSAPPIALLVAAAAVAVAAMAGVTLWWWVNRPGEWVVQTEPKGALVRVGDHSCVAPATLPHLKPGTYKAEISFDGYEPRTVEFKLGAGQRLESGTMTLERSTGRVLLSSDPDGVPYEVKSATDEKGQKFTGETPGSLRLPVGKYAITMRHEGEIKTVDVDVVRNAEIAQSLKFVKAPPPPPPVVAAAPTAPPPPAAAATTTPTAPQPAVAATAAPPANPSADSPPAGSERPATPVGAPSASAPMPAAAAGGSTTPGAATVAAAQAAAAQSGGTPPATNPIPAAASGTEGTVGANIAAIMAAQSVINEPPAGYWKLEELFAGTAYSGYSERGRRFLLYRTQQVLKEKGHYKSSADGAPGKNTHKAIAEFQTANGLPATGLLDSATLSALGLNGLADNSDWGRSSRSSSSSRGSDDEDKTIFRKAVEGAIGKDLRDVFKFRR